MTRTVEPITLYTSNYCGHSRRVEHFLVEQQVSFRRINIDEDAGARERLIELNGGFASVPTLVFADGSKLVEPPLFELRQRFGLPDANDERHVSGGGGSAGFG